MLIALFALEAQATSRTTVVQDSGTDEEELVPALPSCKDQYPFQLVQLPFEPGLYQRFDPARSFGTPALVDAIGLATARVAMEFPDADPVFVGDISRARGGPLPPHRTHDDGRSVDVGLYVRDGAQPISGFEWVDPQDLDLDKTWTLIDGFLSTGRVQHILLDPALIAALQDWLLEDGRLTDAEVARIFPSAAAARSFPSNGILRPAPNHRDHFHVRFRCE